jgi:hypothetical protein
MATSELKWYSINESDLSVATTKKVITNLNELIGTKKMLMPLLEKFLNAIKNDDSLVIAATVLLSIILISRSALKFIEDRKKHRNEMLENALNHEFLDENVRATIQESRNSFYFEAATGITANKQLRAQIIGLGDRSDGKITISKLVKVKDYLNLKEGKIGVEVTTSDVVLAVFNLLLALFVAGLVYVLVIAILAPSGNTITQKSAFLFSAVVLSAYIGYLFSKAVIAWIAKKTSKIIKEIESKEVNLNIPTKENVNVQDQIGDNFD